jgi:predicted acylesterase/phospholipase RssA
MATENYFSLEEMLEKIVADTDQPRVGFAISGGGATGAYEAGVIEAYLRLVKEQPRFARAAPKIVVGTSAGALNAVAMLIDQAGLGLPDRKATTHGFELWRAISEKNEGARYVVGGRAWLVRLATRWLKRPRVRFLFTYVLPLVAAGLVNPVLYAAVFKRLGIFDRFTGAVMRSPGWVSVIAAVIVLGAILLVMSYFRRSAFSNVALATTVANAIAPPRGEPMRVSLLRKADPPRKARQLVEAWRALPEEDRLQFIVTGTDLTARRDALFTMVSQGTYERLADRGWFALQVCDRKDKPQVAEIHHGTTGRIEPDRLIDCVIASTSIPGVFPTQRISLENGAGKIVPHEFVDGGVLNNAPVHIAIDAGATHVLSLELNPMRSAAPAEVSEWREPPHLVASAIESFATLLANSTSEDVRGATDWNQRIEKLGQPDEKKADRPHRKKRIIPLFRVAPIEKRAVDVVDFNGHYEEGRAPPNPSLLQWAEQGLEEAATRHAFWNATFVEAPAWEERPPEPKDCPRCAAKAAGIQVPPVAAAAAAAPATPAGAGGMPQGPRPS